MKTSFYIITFLLVTTAVELIPGLNKIAGQFSVLIGLAAVYAISHLSFHSVFRYQEDVKECNVLEDVYTGNIDGFTIALKAKLRHYAILCSICLVGSLLFFMEIFSGTSSGALILVLLLIMTGIYSSRLLKIYKVMTNINKELDPQLCVDASSEIFGYDYTYYYDKRINCNAIDMLPERPHHLKTFEIFSIVVASIVILLGLGFLIISIFLHGISPLQPIFFAGMGVFFLYAGIRDAISSANALGYNSNKQPNSTEAAV